jgi:hypothetical protein
LKPHDAGDTHAHHEDSDADNCWGHGPQFSFIAGLAGAEPGGVTMKTGPTTAHVRSAGAFNYRTPLDGLAASAAHTVTARAHRSLIWITWNMKRPRAGRN